MYNIPLVSCSINATRLSLLTALAVFTFLNVSCSGDSANLAGAGSAAKQAGTGSVPLYDASTQHLILPQLRMGVNIVADVKLNLKSQGNWAVV